MPAFLVHGNPDSSALWDGVIDKLVSAFPTFAIPGVVDGKVLTEPIGTALAAGQFARVPVLNGTNHDEERLFVSIGLAVTLAHLGRIGSGQQRIETPVGVVAFTLLDGNQVDPRVELGKLALDV